MSPEDGVELVLVPKPLLAPNPVAGVPLLPNAPGVAVLWKLTPRQALRAIANRSVATKRKVFFLTDNLLL